ncbi:MAG TPA: glycoside hydrolase family 13 protein [Ruania sp.]|nr:glycoside hydrolase family 13 protein [Ruania sp.]
MTPSLRTGPQVHAPAGPDAQWWRTAVIYQIYPRSFADGDGDGIGDLPGIISRLGHLAELGVDAIWLSPFYTSPQHDAGYDVADYRQVDPRFGTLADADRLIAAAHDRGLRVIVDLVPNHTSDEHRWFQAALQAAPGSPERERYLFRDGRGQNGQEPPTNWQSVFGGDAWTRVTEPDGTPGQWYLHLFDSHQPDLNWQNEEVRAEFDDILRFWLDRGVDGFRVDVAHGLIKDPAFPDWAGHTTMVGGQEDAEPQQAPMWDQPAVHDVYRRWHKILAEYPGERALVAEAWADTPEAIARYVRPDEMQQAFNFDFLCTPWRADRLRHAITEGLTTSDSVGAPTTWVMSNHDVVRASSRLGLAETGKGPNGIAPDDPQPDAQLGLRRARAAALLMLGLPGSAYLYQGEELGLPEHTTLPEQVRQDPAFFRTEGAETGRDGCRVPLPWEPDEPGFGFSPTGKTWLPQPEDWARFTPQAQRGVEGSTYEMYRAALRLRREWELAAGSLAWVELDGAPEGVLALRNGQVLVLVNLAEQPVRLPEGAEVLLSSSELDDGGATVPVDVAVWAKLT